MASDPFDAVSAEIQQPVASQPEVKEVVEVKPRLYTSIAHVMARHPNELSLQLAEMVEVSSPVVWLLCHYITHSRGRRGDCLQYSTAEARVLEG